MTQVTKAIVFPHGNDNVHQLERNIFRTTGVRVLIRIPAEYEIFIYPHKLLNAAKLTMDDTVAVWKTTLIEALNGLNASGIRGRNIVTKLRRRDVVFISPRGGDVSGNTLIKNITFRPELK